ncbi:flagellar motor switch protein FliG, partial [Endozoicomonas sp.]|uniref:flagellar motor switch protein FliG n=1 Tax=Endozoicomonas sp. TaxID=1892382 RepID=UPI00383A986D
MAEQNTDQKPTVAPRAESLPGTVEEAAVFLLLVGEQAASGVIKYLNPAEIRAISHKADSLKVKNRQQLFTLLGQFERDYANASLLLGDYQQQMRQTLQKALGREQARCLVSPPDSDHEPLTGLQLMKPELLATMIQEEPVQFQAAVLACLQTEQASEVIALLPPERAEQVLGRIARLNKLPRSSLQSIVEFLENFLDEQALENILPVAGEQQVANILNLSDTDSREQFLASLQRSDKVLAGRIEDQMLIFEHVVNLSDDGLRKLLGNVEQQQLALSLKGESDEVRQRIYRCMSKRAAGYLREEMEILGAVPLGKVKIARQAIVRIMDGMLKSDEIEMSRGGE